MLFFNYMNLFGLNRRIIFLYRTTLPKITISWIALKKLHTDRVWVLG
ncbi:hypothetical protein SAMN02745746_01854 [Pseudogulbenkiania subflava DSM 22618]|uniref:Uncharacterized protein n=1 Tax=Pseudogulbenkiania subflava DSM 22618 TaxID=1123014 RepID=A0A1Y6BQE7_9NEIS|nr:hypothetical protein SAMN02745746_01854 [Pseudogulbenkiania subflava DSM 22618]